MGCVRGKWRCVGGGVRVGWFWCVPSVEPSGTVVVLPDGDDEGVCQPTAAGASSSAWTDSTPFVSSSCRMRSCAAPSCMERDSFRFCKSLIIARSSVNEAELLDCKVEFADVVSISPSPVRSQ